MSNSNNQLFLKSHTIFKDGPFVPCKIKSKCDQYAELAFLTSIAKRTYLPISSERYSNEYLLKNTLSVVDTEQN